MSEHSQHSNAEVAWVREEDLLAESLPTAVRTSQRGIGARRRLAAAVLAVVGTVGLTALLDNSIGVLSGEGKVLLYLLLVAAVAGVGGILVAITTGVSCAVVISYFFVEPVHSFNIAEGDQAVSLLVFVVIAAVVSGAVEIAVSRTRQANEALAQAETLSTISRPDGSDSETVADVLERARSTFSMESVVLKQRDQLTGDWFDLERAGWASAGFETALRFDIPLGKDHRMLGRGPELFANDQRVLRAFADAVLKSLETRELSAQAEAARELAAVDRQRTALLAAVGHDLRTPLAGIKAAVTSLRQPGVEWSSTDQNDLLGTIEESSDRLDGLISNLLDASRLQAGEVLSKQESIALDRVIAAAVVSVPGASARVHIDVGDDFPLLLADPGLLERVLFNLIDNAVRHGGDHSEIVVSAEATASSAKILVKDSGPGLSAERRDSVFEPFQPRSDREGSAGLGLGLSIAQGFCEAMGGALVVDAGSGSGFAVRIRLPLAPEQAELPA